MDSVQTGMQHLIHVKPSGLPGGKGVQLKRKKNIAFASLGKLLAG